MPSQVTDNLWIGDVEEASRAYELDRLGITHIVNVTAEHDNCFPNDYTYMRIPVQDRSSERLQPYFGLVAAFMEQAARQEGRVLVHCQHGISRSAAFVLAGLMLNDSLTLEAAYARLKSTQPLIEPRREFLRELRQVERERFGAVVSVAPLSIWDVPMTDDDVLVICASLEERVMVLASVAAVGFLSDVEPYRLAIDACVAGVEPLQRTRALSDGLRVLLENYSRTTPSAERARQAFVKVLKRQIETAAMDAGQVLSVISGLRNSSEWDEIVIDHPLAGRCMDEIKSNVEMLGLPVDIDSYSNITDGTTSERSTLRPVRHDPR